MPFYSGELGSVTALLLDENYDPADIVTLAVTSWTIQDQAVAVDVSNCSAEGMRSATRGYTVSWSMSLPAEYDNEPDYIGLYTGETVTLWFKVGDRNGRTFLPDVYHLLQNTLILTSSPVCNSAGDVVRYVLTGTGGKVSYYVSDPPSETPPPVSPVEYGVYGPAPGDTAPGTGSISYPPGL